MTDPVSPAMSPPPLAPDPGHPHRLPPDAGDLAISTIVNGQVRQQSSTAQLHRGVADLVAWISQALPLPAGTVIATGSPGGSGVGRVPPLWLVPGDDVTVAIAGLGEISHTVVAP